MVYDGGEKGFNKVRLLFAGKNNPSKLFGSSCVCLHWCPHFDSFFFFFFASLLSSLSSLYKSGVRSARGAIKPSGINVDMRNVCGIIFHSLSSRDQVENGTEISSAGYLMVEPRQRAVIKLGFDYFA